MISYGYQMEKAGIKNVCRALNIPAEEQNMITKNLEESRMRAGEIIAISPESVTTVVFQK